VATEPERVVPGYNLISGPSILPIRQKYHFSIHERSMPRKNDLPDSLTPAAFQILMALADEARHGLGIVDEVEERSGGEIKLGPGTLYGTIKKLRAVGFIQEAQGGPDPEDQDPRRRYYGLTPKGLEAVSQEARRLELMVMAARSKSLLGPAEGRPC
jgi:DNA-binding PadR family transcriptional regulator